MKKIIFPLLIVLFIMPSLIALFHPGFFLTDDGNSMIIRFSAFYQALRHGQFPVRFLSRLNEQYGYPVADFLYPLFMYLGVPIKIVGFGFVNTVKILFGLSVLSSGLFCYFWLQKRFQNISSAAGALAYALFPYHLWDIYKRGSIGEVLGLAIVPFIFWQIEEQNSALVALGIGLLIPAHNVLALLFLPVILLYLFLSKKFSLRKACLTVILGLGFAAFFWIPALIDKQYIIFDKTIVSDFLKYFLLPQDYSLFGFITLAAIICSIYVIWKQKKILYWFFWIMTLLSIIFALPISQIMWQYIPATYFIQFPFRLLSVTTLGIAFLVALTIDILAAKYIWVIAMFSIALVYFSASNFFSPKLYQLYPETFYSTNVDSTTVKNEYMPIWVKRSATTVPSEKVFLPVSVGTVSHVISNDKVIRFDVTVKNHSVAQVNIIYFPGWEARVDGRDQKIMYDNTYGVIQIPLDKGSHVVIVTFRETTERLLSDFLSVFSLVFLIIIFFHEKKKI